MNLRRVLRLFIRLEQHVARVHSLQQTSVVSRIFLLASTLLLCIPVAFVTLLIRPFVYVRFWPIHGDRLGHLIIETDLLITRVRPENAAVVFVCFFVGKPANSYYATLLRPHLFIVSSLLGDAGYLSQRTVMRRMTPQLPMEIRKTRGTLAPRTKWVTDDFERARVESLLEDFGLESGQKYVCMWVRDSIYGRMAMEGRSQDFANYRDASIRNYHLMCQLLSSEGFKVIRMGRAGVKDDLDGSPPYIDYLSSKLNSEENDFLLAKYCSFAVCGDSGSVMIPLLYRKPIALTNIGSFIGAMTSECVQVLTMKRLEWVKTGLPLSASEIKQYGVHEFNNSRQFESIGIRHVENSESELEGVGIDMLNLLGAKRGAPSLGESEIQAGFRERVRELLLEEPNFVAGNLWLENNPQFAK